MANPSGPRAGGPNRLAVKAGESLRLRFGVLLHAGLPDRTPPIAEAYQAFLEKIKKD